MIRVVGEGAVALDLVDLLDAGLLLTKLHDALAEEGVSDGRGQLPVVLLVNCGSVAEGDAGAPSGDCGDAMLPAGPFQTIARAVRDELARQRRARSTGDEPAWLIGVREEHMQWMRVPLAEAPELAQAVDIVHEGGGADVYSEYVRTRGRDTWRAHGPDGKDYDQLAVSPIPGTQD